MGRSIRIEEETGHLMFRIRFTSTGNEMDVMVDEDKQALFRERISKNRNQACPFSG